MLRFLESKAFLQLILEFEKCCFYSTARRKGAQFIYHTYIIIIIQKVKCFKMLPG